MAILTLSDYPSVRYAIDIDLSADDLPDAVIDSSIYLGAAELWVRSIDADAETRTGDEQTHVLNAAIYYCAYLLIPAIRQRISHTTQLGEDSQLSVKFKDFDWQKRQKDLFNKANQELQMLADVTDDAIIPSFFEVAAGGRGN